MSHKIARLALLMLAASLHHAAQAQVAAPAPHHVHHRRAASHHVPPSSPTASPLASASSPAPVPNEAVAPPDGDTPHAEVAPRVFALHYPPQGDGYVTGSSPQAMDDRNAAKATGVQATVPLPQ